jgi:hypothetical protein
MSILVIVLLFFLFWGEPDVYDALHDKAMSSLETKDSTNNPK